MNFKELTRSYFSSLEYERLEDNSKRVYRCFLNKAKEMGPTVECGLEAPKEAHKWYSLLNFMNVSGQTKNIYLSILKKVYSWGETTGHINKNPLPLLHKFVSTSERREPYTKEEIEKLWLCASGIAEKRCANFVRALFWTGCRPSELIKTKWEDIGEELISIRSAKRREKGKVSRKCNIVKNLRECLDWAKSDRSLANNYVFRGLKGFEMSSESARRYLKSICKRAEISYKPLRSTRSGLATEMIKKGYSLYDVKETLGHKSINTTEIYLRESIEEKASRFQGL